MKTQVLVALMMSCVLNLNLMAQRGSSIGLRKDTLIITVNSAVKVLVIGNSMSDIAAYTRADSLKDCFIADLEKAKQQPSFPSGSKMIHYFVHPNGKRRLKAENEDYQEPVLDVAKEIRSMSLDLPPYVYIIYDIGADCEVQIYLAGPERIVDLRDVRLTDAIHSLVSDKKALRKYYRIWLESGQGQWKRKMVLNKSVESLEVRTMVGAGIFGSQLSPDVGIELSYVFSDKYSIPTFRIGGSMRSYLFSSYANREFGDFYQVTSSNVSVMFFDSKGASSSVRWAGLEAGILSADGGFLDNTYKLGVVYTFNSIQVAFDMFESSFSFKKGKNNSNPLFAFSTRVLF